MTRPGPRARHLVVVGAQRCGTTYLHDLLEAHPQVAMARPARPEPKAFLVDPPPDADAYRRQWFGHVTDESVLGEKSTSYLEHADVPDRLAATLGSPQVLVQLRDPVARAVSNWGFSRDHGVETRPLAEALRADLAGPQPWDRERFSVSPLAYARRGRYVEDLGRWTERFDVRVQFLEELLTDPATVTGLHRWLGIDDTAGPTPTRAPVNASTPVREALDAPLLRDLRTFFHDSDEALADLLGRPLPWQPGKAT